MFRKSFQFGNSISESNAITVSAKEFYNPQTGYGFIREQERCEQESLQILDINSAFDTFYWYKEEEITRIEEDIYGCFLDSVEAIRQLENKAGEEMPGESRKIPLCFKADVPEAGNYKVTISIHAEEGMEEVMIFAERRRLIFRGKIEKGTTLCHTAVVNVCNIIPRGKTEEYEDKTLDITIVADKPRLTKIEIEQVNCPTIYVAGDSTVADQKGEYPYSPGTCYCGWAQMLTGYLSNRIVVSNHAHSGLTTESFRQEGHYGIVQKYMKAGDFLFIQFGHNDQKCKTLQAFGGYRDNLIRYVKECKEKGVFPVLITPTARNTWFGTGEYNDLLKENAEAVFEVGREMNVPVLDLHALAMEFIKKHGMEAAKAYFFPGDFTHANDYGGYLLAGFIATELKSVCGKELQQVHEKELKHIQGEMEYPAYRMLAECVTDGFGPWEAPDRIVYPKKPLYYDEIMDSNPASELLADVERLEEAADRASVLDMLIRAARFVPVYVYNDSFPDVIGHEWYAGSIESACQNGIIPEFLLENGKLQPDKTVTLEELFVLAIGAYRTKHVTSQRISEALSEVLSVSFGGSCSKMSLPYIKEAFTLGLLDETMDLQRIVSRGEVVDLCRKLMSDI